jgi:predicted neutral ceramidase superfamily lipid hydrolase
LPPAAINPVAATTPVANPIPPAPASTAWLPVAADHVAKVVEAVVTAAAAVEAVAAAVAARSVAEQDQRLKGWTL